MKQAPIIIVFGITGDLSKRKLLPALYHLLRQDVLPAETTVIGSSRRELSVEDLLDTVELCVLETDKVCDPDGLQKVKDSLETIRLDPGEGDFTGLKQRIDAIDPDGVRERLFYMSIPASAYAPIVHGLADSGLNGGLSRLLLEKPFGHDYDSAQSLVELLGDHFAAEQVYRIDHYLAKETAQNLLAFRKYNPMFAPLWNGGHIDKVHIRALEKLDLEGRANFYEETGAVRDLIQSHLLQLLAISLMNMPHTVESDAIHAQKQLFFDGLMQADPAAAVRAQYNGYRDEADNPDSHVETYARVTFTHDSDQWRAVPMILETGKALDKKLTMITVTFKAPDGGHHNRLEFQIDPDEGISLDLLVQQPGFSDELGHVKLDFRYNQSFDGEKVDAYERVLVDAIHGDQALFASDGEVLATWRSLQPLLEAWGSNGDGMRSYPKGADARDICS